MIQSVCYSTFPQIDLRILQQLKACIYAWLCWRSPFTVVLILFWLCGTLRQGKLIHIYRHNSSSFACGHYSDFRLVLLPYWIYLSLTMWYNMALSDFTRSSKDLYRVHWNHRSWNCATVIAGNFNGYGHTWAASASSSAPSPVPRPHPLMKKSDWCIFEWFFESKSMWQ